VALTEGLAVERSEHKQMLAAKDRKILRLRKQIEQLTIKTTTERTAFQEKMQRERDEFEQIYNTTQKELSARLNTVSTKLATDGQHHWLEEMSHHRKKYNKSREVTLRSIT
jgi:CRP-like cAMP-binding protein